MKTIWKYQLEIIDSQMIPMPYGAEMLSVQLQNGYPCLWVLVETKNRKVPIWIHTYEIGHEIQDHINLEYISTYQIIEKGLVFHVFERVI